MNTLLAQRKYRLAIRLSTDTAKTFGLWAAAAYALLQAVQGVFRVLTGFDADYGNYLVGFLPLLLLAISWVNFVKAYPSAIGAGMTRREFGTAYALFSALLIAAGFAFTQLIVIVAELTDSSAYDGFYGAAPIDALTRAAVYVTAGAAAGAIIVRFDRDLVKGTLAGVLIAMLLLRQIPLQIAASEAPSGDGDLVFFEFPADGVPLAPLDAVLTVAFVLIAWLALARAPMPDKKA
ncbi:hypothetical protein O1R50_09465 [Glycomyces luteolus]|uniref:Uncharacterized protein n=1 Tax=Glycomyces luteolus TaxID=2670330 RepID=A0A9X3PAQ2_9ACTN|nr:hypothetical protein [Glycomyces luteolus]MDA1359850.1 hypothetical protein [Glycomyces luteolus]